MGGDRTQAGQTIITLSLKRDGTPTTVFRGARGDIIFSPTLSPDGKWLAYEWRHENHHNIYVDPFPPTGVHHQVTTDGGSNPMWSTEGNRLFYVREADREGEPGRATFHAVNVVRTDTSFEHGKPITLFSVDRLFIAGSGPGNIVDLAPDGKKFVSLDMSNVLAHTVDSAA